MFEAAELGSKISKADYEARIPQLRVDLVNAQYDLRKADFLVLIVLVGNDRLGVSDLVNRFNGWMDARYVETRVFGSPTPEEREHPRFWRYWRALPGRGQISIYTGAFVLDTVGEHLDGEIDEVELDRRLQHMQNFEETLTDAGALVLKFWIHLPRAELKKRIKKANKRKQDAWRVDAVDERLLEQSEEIVPLAERVLRKTDSDVAPWQIVEGTDARHRDLAVAETILASLTRRLEQAPATEPASEPASEPETCEAERASSTHTRSVLDGVDLSARLEHADYKERRDALQSRLRRLSLKTRESNRSSILVFEGWDAAGKGGVIRRLTQAMDVQDYRIVPIAAPTDEELAHHYLWRFWRQLPRRGRVLIFDRSWYGRVLVERVEGLTPVRDWRRAYAEINDFEEQLVEDGMLLLKFWLHLHPDEQLRRFREREGTPYKKYKITDEDYRNRARWSDYEKAVDEMVARTSHARAPWKLVSSNDKPWARVEVLRTVCDALEEHLEG